MDHDHRPQPRGAPRAGPCRGGGRRPGHARSVAAGAVPRTPTRWCKGVMLLLALASVACWAIILDKLVRIAGLRRQARAFESSAPRRCCRGPAAELLWARVLTAGLAEWHDPTRREPGRAAGADRAGDARDRAAGICAAVEPGLPVLATIGSAGPFIGLFGTVWGIMRSFTAHRRHQRDQPRRRRARHCRGAVRDRDRPRRRDPGGGGLQQARDRPRPPRPALRRRHRRSSARDSPASPAPGLARAAE